jgi:hypothetical protein
MSAIIHAASTPCPVWGTDFDAVMASHRSHEAQRRRCGCRLTDGRIPLVELSNQLDQLLEQSGRVIFAVAHNDR